MAKPKKIVIIIKITAASIEAISSILNSMSAADQNYMCKLYKLETPALTSHIKPMLWNCRAQQVAANKKSPSQMLKVRWPTVQKLINF